MPDRYITLSLDMASVTSLQLLIGQPLVVGHQCAEASATNTSYALYTTH